MNHETKLAMALSAPKEKRAASLRDAGYFMRSLDAGANLVREYGPKAVNAVKSSGPRTRVAAGAALGALGSKAMGPGDEYVDKNGNIKRKSTALRTAGMAATGAALGGLSHPEGRQWASARMKGLHKLKTEGQTKKASVFQAMEAQLEKQAIALSPAMAQMAGRGLSAVRSGMGQAANVLSRYSVPQVAGVGAALGTGYGVYRHFRQPKDQRGSLAASALGGAAAGAAIGGAGKYLLRARQGTPVRQLTIPTTGRTLPAQAPAQAVPGSV